jgi:(p)ppGpp synthase/HD superfamily hydrolase
MKEMPIEYWIEKMREIATDAHHGQIRTNGKPYITHPERVAAKVKDRLKPIAWGHDLLEDTCVTLDDLQKAGFPPYVLAAVDVLTHKHGDSNNVYWHKILTNKDALQVKLADIEDNEKDSPSEHAKEKYVRAKALFKKYGVSI